MTSRLLHTVVVLVLGAALSAGAVAPAAPSPWCPPTACAAAADAVRAQQPLPDVTGLHGAEGVADALAAAVPDLPSVGLQPPGSLAAELGWWLDRLGAVPTPPPPIPDPAVERAVVGLLAAARQAETLRAAAVPAEASEDARELGAAAGVMVDRDHGAATPDARLLRLGAAVDRDGLLRAAAVLAAAVDRALGDVPALPEGDCAGEPQPPQVIGGVVAVDLEGVPTLYRDPYLVSLDLGGCDRYISTVAGANGVDGQPLGIALDLGAEADEYANPADSFGLGAAQAGIALLLDQGGDDRYLGTGRAAMGGGVVGGVGLLADLAGDDRYVYSGSGGGFGAQGFGTLGVGALLDLGGDDAYTYAFDPGETPAGFTRLLSIQGTSGVGGAGVLADAAGDDRYTVDVVGNAVSAQAHGTGTFFGAGTLVDGGGDDQYEVRVTIAAEETAGGSAVGQAYGALNGVGVLVDGGGRDAYHLEATATAPGAATATAVGQGFAMGALTWAGAAALVDVGGDDEYVIATTARADDPARQVATSWGQGLGLWEGAALHADLGGDDRRLLTADAPGGTVDRSGQGTGLAAATGVLLDRAGNDRYDAGSRSQGYGGAFDFGGGLVIPGGIGVLVDGAGRNDFSGPGRHAHTWTQGEDGVGFGTDGGGATGAALALADYLVGLFGTERPRPTPSVTVTTPADGAVLHGDATLAGTAAAAVGDADAVEWRADTAAWQLASKDGTWAAWTAEVDVDALADGPHVLAARAWSAGLDSDPVTVGVDVQRWLVGWQLPSAPDAGAVDLAFALHDRSGRAVASEDVTLRVVEDGGDEVAAFTVSGGTLETSAGGYQASWEASTGRYTLTVELPGQRLGRTTLEIGTA